MDLQVEDWTSLIYHQHSLSQSQDLDHTWSQGNIRIGVGIGEMSLDWQKFNLDYNYNQPQANLSQADLLAYWQMWDLQYHWRNLSLGIYERGGIGGEISWESPLVKSRIAMGPLLALQLQTTTIANENASFLWNPTYYQGEFALRHWGQELGWQGILPAWDPSTNPYFNTQGWFQSIYWNGRIHAFTYNNQIDLLALDLSSQKDGTTWMDLQGIRLLLLNQTLNYHWQYLDLGIGQLFFKGELGDQSYIDPWAISALSAFEFGRYRFSSIQGECYAPQANAETRWNWGLAEFKIGSIALWPMDWSLNGTIKSRHLSVFPATYYTSTNESIPFPWDWLQEIHLGSQIHWGPMDFVFKISQWIPIQLPKSSPQAQANNQSSSSTSSSSNSPSSSSTALPSNSKSTFGGTTIQIGVKANF